MNDIDEEVLIKQAKRGDKRAAAEIYNRNYEAVFHFISYRVGSRSTAEDLTADVFIKMLENLDTYQHRGRPLVAWLYTIARNLVIDHYRQNDKSETLPIKDNLLAGEHGHPPEVMEQHQSQNCFRRALYHLTEPQRSVITHKILDERTTNETASIMGKSERAVRSLQYRALQALEKALEEENCV